MARKLEVEIVGDPRSLHRALNQSTTSTNKFGGVLQKLKYAAVGAGAAVGTGLAIGIEKSVKAAMDAEKVNARLGVAFKNAGLNAKTYEAQINKLDATGRRLGFTDEETKTSLGSLIIATKSYAKAARDVSVAQDIARFKGVSLTDATKMLTMAMTGSQRAAKQLGITVSPVTTAYDKLKASNIDLTTATGKAAEAHAKLMDKFATGQAVIDAVTQKVHGQADAFSKTAAGSMEMFKAQLHHIEVAIGEKLLPVMTRAIQYIFDHWPQISAAIKSSWDQIKPILNALGGLIISIVQIVRTHWSTIGPIVMQVVAVVRAQLAIITGIIRFFAAILRGDWSAAWNALKGIVAGVFNELRAILTAQKDIFVALMKGLGTALLMGFRAAINAGLDLVKAAVTGLFHKVIGWVKDALGIGSPSKVFYDIGRNSILGYIHGVGSMAGALKNAVINIAKGLPGKALGSLGLGGSAPSTVSKNANVELGRKMASAYGWGGGMEFSSLFELWQRESGWSNKARNPSSGAYGIPQALPPTKMPYAAQAAGGSSAAAQIGWGLNYIKQTYGDPIRAWGHEQAAGWYAKGGIFDKPTVIGVGESGPEAVVPLTRGGGLASVVHEHHYHGPVMQDATFVRYLEGLGARSRRRG